MLIESSLEFVEGASRIEHDSGQDVGADKYGGIGLMVDTGAVGEATTGSEPFFAPAVVEDFELSLQMFFQLVFVDDEFRAFHAIVNGVLQGFVHLALQAFSLFGKAAAGLATGFV